MCFKASMKKLVRKTSETTELHVDAR